jgi:DNA replication protein DnaC
MTRGLALPVDSRAIKNLLFGFFKREVEKRKNNFMLTEELKRNLSSVGEFLVTEKRYYGLFMPGSVGNGKTSMLKAIRDLLVYLVDKGTINYCEGDKYPRFVTSREMANIAKDPNDFRALKSAKYLLIDDLCEEPVEVVSYGNYIYPFIELLEYRYDQMLPTFISSNFNADSISKKYRNERLQDRMKEMFKIISFVEESFR